MVDTMCEVLNYIVPTIVVLALELSGLSMCSECIVILYTVKKVWRIMAVKVFQLEDQSNVKFI